MKLARWMLSQDDGSFSCSICESWHWIQTLKDTPTLRLLWSVTLLCVVAKWPAHQQGQVEWQVGVPCMWALWSLPSHFACKEVRCWEVVLQRCHFDQCYLPSFEDRSFLSFWSVSLSSSPHIVFLSVATWLMSNSQCIRLKHIHNFTLSWRSNFEIMEETRVANTVNLIGSKLD